jgi:hypothetical protein
MESKEVIGIERLRKMLKEVNHPLVDKVKRNEFDNLTLIINKTEYKYTKSSSGYLINNNPAYNLIYDHLMEILRSPHKVINLNNNCIVMTL